MVLTALCLWIALAAPGVRADESICARVKMEVAQEVTLERQAFDAHMRIHNGLDLMGLEDVGVVVTFLDQDGRTIRASSDPDDTSALFFIRLGSLQNITGVDGLGTVPPKTSADIHWLIIPAPGASRGVDAGTLYSIGATLTYTLGGEPHSTTVTPDIIFVKPMPEMVLDYFLPADVFGDDPLTAEVEPPEPFSLGLRVRNNGTGTARSMKIESAQPRIVENLQGLPVTFAITGTEVNGVPAARSLLADLGDLAPKTSATARWTMTCPISGRFVELRADFSHADELGGALTSLIDSVSTHLLLRDVLADLPGRDSVRDFLAQDGDILRVYESEGVDTPALDRSSASSLQEVGRTGSQAVYSLSTPATPGFVLIQLADPEGGRKVLKEVLRSDGKRIKPENRWLASTRAAGRPPRHTVGLFDADSTGSYRIVMDDPGQEPRAPVLQAIPDQLGVEGRELTFTVSAADPDGPAPTLSASPLPATARFSDSGGGLGAFTWVPAAGQAGRYELTVTASDGRLQSSRRVALTVCSAADSDCDTLDDAWEIARFGSLERDGTGDLDGDGITDFMEYWRGTDPTRSNAPSVPEILRPADGSEVSTLRPPITVRNGSDPDPQDVVSHRFELYAEPGMTRLAAEADGLFGPGGETTWTVPRDLPENTWAFFRVRATDGRNFSPWAYGSFFVNRENDAPGDFRTTGPTSGAEAATLTPVLAVTNSWDPDGDGLTYTFDVYADRELTTLAASGTDIPEGPDGSTTWTVTPPLSNHRTYYWRATATDEHGKSAQTELATLAVNLGNRAPSAPSVIHPPPGAEVASSEVEIVLAKAEDPDGDPLSCTFELDTASTFDSLDLKASGPLAEGALDTRWVVRGLNENTMYHFRARAGDGAAESPWAVGSFFVNGRNEPPATPTVRNPGDGSWVQTVTPQLELNHAADPDRDGVTYRFELLGGGSLEEPLALGDSDGPSWTVPVELPDNCWYRFRGRAVDEHGAESRWSADSRFFVNDNGVDDAPSITIEEPSTDRFTSSPRVEIRWRDSDPDSNAGITLYYARDPGGESRALIASGIGEDPDGPSDTFVWEASAMPDGNYWLAATIADASTQVGSVSPGRITLDRAPPSVQASPPGGFYPSPQEVRLGASEPAAITYTLDGTEPSAASPRYVAPIEVDDATTLRFMAVDRAGNASPPALETYTIGSGNSVSRFRVSAPSRVRDGQGFPVTLRALSPSGALVRDFSGRVRLSVSAGALAPTAAEPFSNGVWKGSVTLTGARGPVTLTAALRNIRGESRPILVQCEAPRPPVLKSPMDGARRVEMPPTFAWHASPGAASYTLELAADPDFRGLLLTAEGIAGNALTAPESVFSALEPGEPCWWRVRPNGPCGPGPFSRPRRFTPAARAAGR